MKVLLTYTSYPLSVDDWRGRFMFELAHELAAHPNVALRLWGPPGPIPEQAICATSPQDAEWLRQLLMRGGIAHLLRSSPVKGLMAATGLLYRLGRAYRRNANVDLVHVNWLQNAIGLLGTRTPALVSTLGSDFRLLSLPGMVPLLRAVFRQRRCILAPNGGWMVPVLQKHFGDVTEIRYVPFGIDQRWFAIQRQLASAEPRRWLVVLRVTVKKIGPLFEWGEGLFSESDELHLFGPMQENVPIPPWVHYHGPTNPDALAKEWYPKAAGMISLSTHDEGRPQVLLEAMAAGLPVLVSPIPAHRDLVIDGENGRLIESADALRAALASLHNLQPNVALGKRARDWVRNNIGTWEDCADRYVDIYRELCGCKP
jgi:hypothetical protein